MKYVFLGFNQGGPQTINNSFMGCFCQEIELNKPFLDGKKIHKFLYYEEAYMISELIKLHSDVYNFFIRIGIEKSLNINEHPHYIIFCYANFLQKSKDLKI